MFLGRVSAGLGNCMNILDGSRMGPQPHVCHECLCRCSEAAKAGNLHFLQSKAHNLEGFWLEQISLCAASGGRVEVLRWAREQGCHLDAGTCAAAAGNGHLTVLRWARHNGCAWSSSTCEAAARGGHLAVLKFARRNGCAWSSRTCEAAARGGHLAVLQFAH